MTCFAEHTPIRRNDNEGPEGPSLSYLTEMITSAGWWVPVAC